MDNFVNYLQSPAAYNRELFRTYKRIFSGVIKETFLIEMINKVQNDPRYGIIFMETNDPNSLLSLDRMVVGKGFNATSTCKMIVMSHYANTVALTDYERGKKQESNLYKDKLTNDVMNMFRIEKLATPDFSNSSLESYLPLIYYISALCNYCGNKYEEFSNNRLAVKAPYNSEFNYRMIYKLIMKIKACINLADIRATDELMVLYRTLIELFMTYAALWDGSDSVINSFYEFDQAAFDYNYSGTIPEPIKIMARDMGADPVKFVNYGWIKNLNEFKNLTNKSRSFNLGGLGKILDKKCGYFCPDLGSELYKFYKTCNPQTHGTMLIMNYLQLELHIFQNIAVMLKFICEIMSKHLFDVDFKYGNIDLIDELNVALNESRKVYDWLNLDDKNLIKTNLEYRNRAIFSMRMKK